MDTKEFVFKEKLLEETDVLCLFGFDPTDIKKQLEPWISSGDKEVVFVDANDFSCLEDFLKISKQRAFQRFSYHVSPFLEELAKKEMQTLAIHYQTLQWHAHTRLSDYQDFGVTVFRNICKNLARNSDTKTFGLLKNSLKGLPAFICGAAPSLEEAIPYLQKIQGQGVVFAGGAALSSLKNIPIHIAAGIDPDPSLQRCQMQSCFDAPFFYQSRFSNELLTLAQGPLIWAPSHCGIRIDENEDFDGGCTVTTFCAAVALHLGCSPVIFVGMDLAYEEGKIKYFQNPSEESATTVLYEGKNTQKDWVIAAKWLENLARERRDVPFYTVSRQGLSLLGIEKITFSNLLEKIDFLSYDIEGAIHSIKAHVENKARDSKNLLKSLRDCSAHVESILSLFEEVYPQDPTSNGSFILHLFALYNEIVYLHLLEPLWNVWKFPLERNLQSEYEKQLHQWLFFKRVLEEHKESYG
jgi:hypothetical protein